MYINNVGRAGSHHYSSTQWCFLLFIQDLNGICNVIGNRKQLENWRTFQRKDEPSKERVGYNSWSEEGGRKRAQLPLQRYPFLTALAGLVTGLTGEKQQHLVGLMQSRDWLSGAAVT